jgi:hypothetical protein
MSEITDVSLMLAFSSVLNTLNMSGDFACKLRSRPRQIASILNLDWRHEARLYQAVGEKIRNPHRVMTSVLRLGTLRMCSAFTSTTGLAWISRGRE